MRVYTHAACIDHDPGASHAERPQRLQAVTEALREALPSLDWHEAPRATRGQLLRVHDEALLALVLNTRVVAPMALDPDTVLGPGSAEAASTAISPVGAASLPSVGDASAPASALAPGSALGS